MIEKKYGIIFLPITDLYLKSVFAPHFDKDDLDLLVLKKLSLKLKKE